MKAWGLRLSLACALSACAKSPDPPPLEDTDGGMQAMFADTIIAFTNTDGVAETCSEGLGCPPAEACASNPALGEPDGSTFALEPSRVIEVAFLCGTILDRAATEGANDLHLVADVPAGSRAVVSVSYDGSTYAVLGYLDEETSELDLQRAELEVARFVRIAHESGEAIAIDAVEALR